MEGIKAIKDTLQHVVIDEKAVQTAIHMYRLGHRDIIDNLLYSIALSKKLKLLTVDAELLEFVRKMVL